MKTSGREFNEKQEELSRQILGFYSNKISSKIEADLLAALMTPRVQLPPVDLSKGRERLYASLTGLGYVAGLAGTKTRPAVFNPDLGAGAEAWESGWRQGRDHRARMLEQAEPPDTFTKNRLLAAMIRCEPVSA